MVPGLPVSAFPLVLRDGISTLPRFVNNPVALRKALDEAIRSFLNRFNLSLCDRCKYPCNYYRCLDNHQRYNAASTAAALEDLRLSSIFRANRIPINMDRR